jgi:hypothetical protein
MWIHFVHSVDACETSTMSGSSLMIRAIPSRNVESDLFCGQPC